MFLRDEQRVVLLMLERSIAFLNGENIETILLQESFDGMDAGETLSRRDRGGTTERRCTQP